MSKKNILLYVYIVISIGIGAIALYFNTTSYQQNLDRYNYLHFGTSIQITLGAGEPTLSAQTIEGIDKLLQTLHYKWHPWRKGDLFQLNKKLATLTAFTTSQENINTIMLSKDLYKSSQGYFNPTIGKLIAYWGFHTDNPNIDSSNNLDLDLDLDSYLRQMPTPDDILINNSKTVVKNTNKFVQLDLSGFIKADAMIKIKNILISQKISNAMINIGGDILIMGYKDSAQKTPWLIAAKSHHQLIPIRVYNNETIATSGTGARFIIDPKNKTFRHHIINPKTGKSAVGFESVTIIHQDPFIADAAATALLIAGEKEYIKIANSMNIDKYILTSTNNSLIISDAMKTRASSTN